MWLSPTTTEPCEAYLYTKTFVSECIHWEFWPRHVYVLMFSKLIISPFCVSIPQFKKKIDRDRHLFVHNIRDMNMTHQCELCDYQASRHVYLEKHYLKHRVLYCCCLCPSKFLSTIKWVKPFWPGCYQLSQSTLSVPCTLMNIASSIVSPASALSGSCQTSGQLTLSVLSIIRSVNSFCPLSPQVG